MDAACEVDLSPPPYRVCATKRGTLVHMMLRGEVLDVGESNLVYVRIPQKYGHDSVKAVTRINVSKGDLVYVTDTSTSRVPQWVVFDKMNVIGTWGDPYPHEHPIGQVAGLKSRLDNIDGKIEKAAGRIANVKDDKYGAKGNGTTNDSAALQAALNDSSLSEVVVPEGTYRITRTLTVPSGTKISMSPRAILDFSGLASNVYLSISGSAKSPIQSARNITEGMYTVPIASPDMLAGDWVLIQSNDVWDPDSTSISQGELIQVRESTSTSTTFVTPVLDNYHTSVKLTPVTMSEDVVLDGGVIRGDFIPGGTKTGIRAQYTNRLRLRNVRFEGISNAHCFIRDSVDARVSECTYDWAVADSTGYGVVFNDATRDSKCVDSVFRNVRHAFTTGNSGTLGAGGIVRRVSFSRNTVEYTSTALGGSQLGGDAVDTHTAAEDVSITDNTIVGSQGNAINAECRTVTITGNLIRNCKMSGINVHNENRRDGQATISRNRIEDTDMGIYARHGVRGTNVVYESLIITENAVSRTRGDGIRVGYYSHDRGLVLTGNTVRDASGLSISVKKQDGAVVSGNRVIGGSGGIAYDNIKNSILGPNSVDVGRSSPPWVGSQLDAVTYSTFSFGSVFAPTPGCVGVLVNSTCSDISVDKANHLQAAKKYTNDAGASVS